MMCKVNYYEKIAELLEQNGDQIKHKNGKDYNYVNESSLDSFALLNFIAYIRGHFFN